MNWDDEAIERIALGFEATTLPDAEWTHTAHLYVALRYVRRHGPREGLSRMREGLLRWVGSRGKLEAYHETITRAYIAIVAAFLSREDRGQPLSQLGALLVERCGAKDYLSRFYSRERLFSDEARARFVVPDLVPLPSAIGDAAIRETAA